MAKKNGKHYLITICFNYFIQLKYLGFMWHQFLILTEGQCLLKTYESIKLNHLIKYYILENIEVLNTLKMNWAIYMPKK